MSESANYWSRQRLGRRSLLKGAAVGGVGVAAAALIGCGESEDTPPAGNGGGTATTGGGSGTATAPEAGAIKRGGKMTLVAASDAPHLDPGTTFVTTSAAIWGLTYNRLVTPNYGGDAAPNTIDAQPDLAESWEITPDGLEYVFKLRPGVTFQDVAPVSGRELTAEDVAYSFERSATIEGSANSNLWAGVTSYEALDDQTFKMTREEPNADFFNQMASQYAVVYAKEMEDSLETT
ncbi:MAG: ABC transporter substrate-binding protein, partial [Dehalococcoidia bacterium]